MQDKLKRAICKENGIFLLETPYDIDKYMNNNIKIPKNLLLFDHNTPEFGQYRLDNFF